MNVLLAMGLFVFVHMLLARPAVKGPLVARLGPRAYLIAYSVLSLLLLAGVISTLAASPRTVLWPSSPWSYWFAAGLSLCAFLLLGMGFASANPLSVSLRRDGYRPQRPGVVGWTRHPILWGFASWGAAHVPVNGEWPSLALFAGTVVFALVGVRVVERRTERRLGREELAVLSPSAGHLNRPAAFGAALGLIAWATVLWLHPYAFGADPLGVLRQLCCAS